MICEIWFYQSKELEYFNSLSKVNNYIGDAPQQGESWLGRALFEYKYKLTEILGSL